MYKICLLAFLVITSPVFSQMAGENGLSTENNAVKLGGKLTAPTLINGDNFNLRFTNLDTFFLGGRYVQMVNSTKKTFISSFDSLLLQSFQNIGLHAPNLLLAGVIKLNNYKNSAALNSVLTVDNCGNLKLVSQQSLQTIAKNAFINGGNSFGFPAVVGTSDKQFLFFKSNNINRGNIDTLGIFNYNFGVNINKAKLKLTGDVEINGEQALATADYQKATNGINFVWGGEPLPRSTISFGAATSSLNFTAHTGFKFYTSQPGAITANSIPDLAMYNGLFKFGNKMSRKQADEPSAAYQFFDYIDSYGVPKGFLLPRVAQTTLMNSIKNPAVGLILFNQETNELQMFKADGWHKFVTENTAAVKPVAPATSYVRAIGNGTQKTFRIVHNLQSQYVMVQFIDCGPEANCNVLATAPKGVRVELNGINEAVVTFSTPPSFERYKIMFLRIQQ